MSINVNTVVVGGNLARDPEMRYAQSGFAIASVAVAVNRRVKGMNGAQDREEVTFIPVEATGKTAEFIGQYLRKGSPAVFEGRVKTDVWDDKQTGKKRSKTLIHAMTVHSPGGGGGGGQGRSQQQTFQQPASQPQQFQQPRQGGGYQQAPPQQAPAGNFGPQDGDDDLPF